MPMTSGVLLPHTSGYDERDVMLLLSAEFQIAARQKSAYATKRNLQGASQGNRWITFQTNQLINRGDSQCLKKSALRGRPRSRYFLRAAHVIIGGSRLIVRRSTSLVRKPFRN